MKYVISLIAVLMMVISLPAQTHIKISAVRENRKTILYVANSEACEVSIVLRLRLTNLAVSDGYSNVFVIPAGATNFKLTELKATASYTHVSFTYDAYFGNVKQVVSDEVLVYDLPFEKGLSFTVNQGYNGIFSHKNENALDFNMPIGTNILAANDGVVVAIVDTFIGACLTEACKKKANYILIRHNDGTFAYYAHIQYAGAKVNVGQIVKKDYMIAVSGNTGYTKGPHLHFVCFVPRINGRETLATRFRVGNGITSQYLQEGKMYKKRYN
jgi:hypothetical protein